MSTTLNVGDAAPDFTLPSTDGKPFSLHEAAGNKNVVLAFFPAAAQRKCRRTS
jgi:peroxiredoxin